MKKFTQVLLCFLLMCCYTFAENAQPVSQYEKLPKKTLHEIAPEKKTFEVRETPVGFKYQCPKKKKHTIPVLKKVQDLWGCITCQDQSGNTEVTLSSVYQGSDGNAMYQYSALNHLKNGTVVDQTKSSGWSNNNPQAFPLKAPGLYEMLEPGVIVNEDTIIYIQMDDCSSGCYEEEINIEWKITTAITFSAYAGSTVQGTCGLKPSPLKQTCAVRDSCTASTTPSMTSEGGPIVGICISSKDSCAVDQGWSTLSYCWGFYSQGPFCSVIPFLGSNFRQQLPGECTPLSDWPSN